MSNTRRTFFKTVAGLLALGRISNKITAANYVDTYKRASLPNISPYGLTGNCGGAGTSGMFIPFSG